MTPGLIRRGPNNLDALGFHIFEQLVELPIDPELRLDRPRNQEVADTLLHKVNRYRVSIQHGIHLIGESRFEAERATVPVDGGIDVGNRIDGVRSLPFHSDPACRRTSGSRAWARFLGSGHPRITGRALLCYGPDSCSP